MSTLISFMVINIWGSTRKTNLEILRKAQKRIVRAICGAGRIASSAPLLKSCGLLNIDGIFSYMCGLYVYKSLRNAPYNVFSYQNGPYNTRMSERTILKTPRTNCNHSRQAIRYTGVVKFNRIPEDIKRSETYDNFKQKYKKFLLEENVPTV